jgi:MFS family permease
MQPNPWDGQQPDHKQPEAVMMGNVSAEPSVLGHPGIVPGQVIMVQQPSGAAKVIGILVIISGCFGVMSGLMDIVGSLSYSSVVIPLIIAILGLAGSAASVLGGYWMTNYERRGVQLVLITVLVGFIAASASSFILGDLLQEKLDNGNMTQEEYDATQGFGAKLGGIMIAVSAVCYGICGLIIAIPLMSANGGLDDSSLFS